MVEERSKREERDDCKRREKDVWSEQHGFARSGFPCWWMMADGGQIEDGWMVDEKSFGFGAGQVGKKKLNRGKEAGLVGFVGMSGECACVRSRAQRKVGKGSWSEARKGKGKKVHYPANSFILFIIPPMHSGL